MVPLIESLAAENERLSAALSKAIHFVQEIDALPIRSSMTHHKLGVLRKELEALASSEYKDLKMEPEGLRQSVANLKKEKAR